MTGEERPGPEEVNSALTNSPFRELGLSGSQEPVAPAGMTAAETQELQVRADLAVRRLEEASGSKEMELVDSITTIGVRAQRQAGQELELLRVRVVDLLAGDGTGRKVSQDLLELRQVLDKINPHELRHTGFRRITGSIPILHHLYSLVSALKRIAIKYETVATQVQEVENQLREGRRMLARDNIELRQLYQQVEDQQLALRKNAYLGELLMQRLEETLERNEDSTKAARLRDVLYDIAVRVQDLRAMEEVHLQFFVSIDMTRQNNTRLGQSVDRTLTLATNTVMIGLALQSALARQKRVLEAAQRTREFIGEMMLANAASVRLHTAEIGDIYSSPVVAIEKLTQAHNDLIEAIEMVDRLKTEGIDVARQNIARLQQLSEELREKSEGLSQRREAPPLEA